MIKLTLKGIEPIRKFIQELPRGIKSRAMKGIAEYILGNESRGLKHYPAYRYVSRKSAYGVTFFSEAQRGFVMAAIRRGDIVPGVENRSGAIQDGWAYKESDADWRTVKFTNSAPGVQYVMGDTTQAAQPAKVGWRRVLEVITANFYGAIRHAQSIVNAWIKSKGF